MLFSPSPGCCIFVVDDTASNYDNDELSFNRGVELYATMRSPSKPQPAGMLGTSPGHGSLDPSPSHIASSQSSGGLMEVGEWDETPQHGTPTSSASMPRTPSKDTPSHTSLIGTPTLTLSRQVTPTGTLSRGGTPTSTHHGTPPTGTLSRGGTPTGSLSRNGTPTNQPAGTAVRPAAVSGVSTMSGIYRGTISPSSSSSLARRTQSLGRSNSTSCNPSAQHKKAAAMSGSQPGTPTTGPPRPSMTRSSSMNTPPSTAWQYQSSICMKESCV